jgi:hypothetical protein
LILSLYLRFIINSYSVDTDLISLDT